MYALLLCIAAQMYSPRDDAAAPKCQDTSAIKWVLPGEFDVAMKRVKEENRLLVIKGIAFGVDNAGAKCATKGQW